MYVYFMEKLQPIIDDRILVSMFYLYKIFCNEKYFEKLKIMKVCSIIYEFSII